MDKKIQQETQDTIFQFFPGQTVWYISKEVSVNKNHRVFEKRTPTAVVMAKAEVQSVGVTRDFWGKLKYFVTVYPELVDNRSGNVGQKMFATSEAGIRVQETACVPGITCFTTEKEAEKALAFFRRFGLKLLNGCTNGQYATAYTGAHAMVNAAQIKEFAAE